MATVGGTGDQLDLEDSDFLPTRFDGYRRSGGKWKEVYDFYFCK